MFPFRVNFEAASSTAWLTGCVIAGLAALAGVWLLLRAQRKLVGRRTGLALLVLRFTLAGLLLMAVLRPVLEHTTSQNSRGRIVVALDISESMNATDPHAAPADKLRWARGLGMIGNAESRARVDEWIAALDAGRHPRWVEPHEIRPGATAFESTRSRADFINETFKSVDALPRKQIAARLLQREPGALLAALDDVGGVETYLFAGSAQRVERTMLDDLDARAGTDLRVTTTSIAAALQAAHPADERKCLAIILLTDGRDTSADARDRAPAANGADVIAAADVNIDAIGCPVFPIVIGCDNPPRDLAVVAVESPRRVARGEAAAVTVLLDTSGFTGETISVGVRSADKDEPLKKSVTVVGDRTEVRFTLPPRDPGRAEYTLSIDSHPNELRNTNNDHSFSIDVDDARQNVLLVDGEARWEFRHLHNVLSRDPAVSVQAVVFRQPYIGLLDEPFFERTLALSTASSSEASTSLIDRADLIVIGDVGPGEIAQPEWERIEKFVAESGGTLVLSAGRRFFPLAHANPELARLLPLTQLRAVSADAKSAAGTPLERGFRLELTGDGAGETFLALAADESNEAAWRNLPGHAWGIFGRPKPAATVLVRGAGIDREETGGERDNTSRDPNAVIIAQYYGAGRIVWIGIDSTWRWRAREGQSAHEKFWGQLVRWSVAQKRSSTGPVVEFATSKGPPPTGQDVLRARFSEDFLKRHPTPTVRVEIVPVVADGRAVAAGNGAGPVATVTLNRTGDGTREFEARLDALPPGQYRAVLAIPEANLGPQPVTTGIDIDEPVSVEQRDLRTNRQLLGRLAEATGGKLLAPDDARQVVSLIQSASSQSAVERALPLWNHWALLVLILLLLTAEWTLRKRSGLP